MVRLTVFVVRQSERIVGAEAAGPDLQAAIAE